MAQNYITIRQLAYGESVKVCWDVCKPRLPLQLTPSHDDFVEVLCRLPRTYLQYFHSSTPWIRVYASTAETKSPAAFSTVS